MTSSYPAWLAIDLGSSSGRIMVGILEPDAHGDPCLFVTEAARFANIPIKSSEGLGWDINALWGATLEGIRAGLEFATARGATVHGIGVDSWGVDYARLKPDGQLREFVAHHRDVDVDFAAQTSAMRDIARDYRETGVLDQAINTVHQLEYDAMHNRGAEDDTILLIADLFVYLLTGVSAAEASLASSTALVDRRTNDWLTSRVQSVRGRMPQIARSGTHAGTLTLDVAERVGATYSIDVWFVTSHDTAAAFSAVANADTGTRTAVISCGSWAVVGIPIAKPLLTDAARLAGFTQEMGADDEVLLVKNLSGMWLFQETMREWAASDGHADFSVADLRVLLADAALSTYRGIFDPADPALQASGSLVERLEKVCSENIGAAPTSRPALIRAILESLALAYSNTLNQITLLTGNTFESIRMVGGGARNELLCELTAAHTGLPVYAGPAEASVRGVLYQLMQATGHISDIPAAWNLRSDDGENLDDVFSPEQSASASCEHTHRPLNESVR